MADLSTMKNVSFPIPSYEEWKEEVEKSLKGKPIEKLHSMTYEQLQLKPIYTSQDLQSLELEQYPGFPSYVRGTEPNEYIGKPWAVSQELFASSPKEWNEIVKHDLARGQTEIHLVLDRLGFSVTSLEDVETMFSGIPLERYSIRVDAGVCSLPFVALFVAYLQKQSLSLHHVRGTIGMDPLSALAVNGELSISLSTLYDVMADATKWAKEQMPHIKTIIVHGEPYHNGGANAVQELAFSFAAAVEYINECLTRGLTVDEVAERMSFSFAIGADFFMEIAKLRAARAMWSNIVQAFGGNESSQKISLHARTSYFTKTVYDPYVNMLRASAEAFAAIVGGANSLHVSPFDEAIRPADEFSRRIARNTQLILLEEAHIGKVIDPAGGSYYVETLTAQIAEQAWKLFQQIEATGGMTKALQAGVVQAEIEKIAKLREQNVKTRKERIIGTNVYANLAEPKPDIQSVSSPKDESCGGETMERNGNWVDSAIAFVHRRATARGIDAALAMTGSSVAISPIRQWRLSEPFEQLRQAAERHLETHGKRPTVHLINLGAIAHHKARADFMTGFFEAGGFAVMKNDGYMSTDEAIKGALEGDGTHYIICGTDESYPEAVPAIAKALKGANPPRNVYVAGKQPPETETAFVEAGVDGFIHIGSNCYETLVAFMKEMGVALDGAES
ncbi:methylmalonyl-CoA mutase [Anoxybacillus voinovskiensis]|uniref:methylmalonyl-CoA mutase n=1 Tax=Anoxybacteroides voinovskiense TaxID=230470 RepID=A0A840DUQ9_9BACL|nr:methylmalonyl-CoA mutase family protein [Anoxybacillus voinovskiensis]MBB4075315.1 methylmalonyl-CoA mutase [Anoxybacillus voinovskiensis]GGJ78042.1 methylmalonyl-CoA mutase [Anoxybacillus voinovskiensis]